MADKQKLWVAANPATFVHQECIVRVYSRRVQSSEHGQCGREEEASMAGKEVSVAGKEEVSVAGKEVGVAGKEEVSVGGKGEVRVAGKEEVSVGGKEEVRVAGKEEVCVAEEEEEVTGREGGIALQFSLGCIYAPPSRSGQAANSGSILLASVGLDMKIPIRTR